MIGAQDAVADVAQPAGTLEKKDLKLGILFDCSMHAYLLRYYLKKIADVIAGQNYLNQPVTVVEQALTGTYADGPDARAAEGVVNTLPRPRDRQTIHRTPGHHALRIHIVDFLVARSCTLAGARPEGWDGRRVPEVHPAIPHIEETIS